MHSENFHTYVFLVKYATTTDRFYRSQTFRIYVKPYISSQFQNFREPCVMMRLHMACTWPLCCIVTTCATPWLHSNHVCYPLVA